MPIIALSGEQAAQQPEGAALAAAALRGGVWPPRPDDRVLALQEDGAWAWLAAWRKLEFDSEVFGMPLGQAELMHAEAWPEAGALAQGAELLGGLAAEAREAGLAGLSCRVGDDDFLAAQALEAAGGRLADVSVCWEMDLAALAAPPALPKGLTLRPWRESDREALLDMAAAAFCDRAAYADRFALDPRLNHGCPELYRRWMANSLAGEQADRVLVLINRAVAGFITLKRLGDDGAGWVALNAVAPEKRGQGLYNLLLAHGLAWLAQEGASVARVRTKASQRAVTRAWSRLGARPLAGDLTFHLWFNEV
ncbi:MAG: GNAT family N-acetyltransferase [Desulfarculaceae bacterium]|nr:GNAT family N-acetyltransferase [Desulfarculaceae bacterium]MCF8070894.1 GNAT family N-acetyltransferase [Desulfarculaceae bacterium]MCF8100482.1 GNAT family N-acetyltransferase [Desulfarculaceae bacterium]MCF8118089.1 GNAT family N-acetyltransferase [Desulfarculaceae bacterium]